MLSLKFSITSISLKSGLCTLYVHALYFFLPACALQKIINTNAFIFFSIQVLPFHCQIRSCFFDCSTVPAVDDLHPDFVRASPASCVLGPCSPPPASHLPGSLLRRFPWLDALFRRFFPCCQCAQADSGSSLTRIGTQYTFMSAESKRATISGGGRAGSLADQGRNGSVDVPQRLLRSRGQAETAITGRRAV